MRVQPNRPVAAKAAAPEGYELANRMFERFADSGDMTQKTGMTRDQFRFAAFDRLEATQKKDGRLTRAELGEGLKAMPAEQRGAIAQALDKLSTLDSSMSHERKLQFAGDLTAGLGVGAALLAVGGSTLSTIGLGSLVLVPFTWPVIAGACALMAAGGALSYVMGRKVRQETDAPAKAQLQAIDKALG